MKFKKIIAIVLISISLLGGPQYVYAVPWGTLNIGGNMLKLGLETLKDQVLLAIESSLKMIAIKQATSMIETVLYGGSSSPRNIKNFRKFLYEDTQKTAVAYSETFLTNALRGTTSGDYSSNGGNSQLSKDIESAGKNAINNWKGNNTPVVDFASACSGDSTFSDGNFKCFSKIMSNSLNTPIGMQIAVDAAAAAKYEQEIEKQKIEATSSGTIGDKDTETGDIKTPASVVEETQLQQIKMPLIALANAEGNVFQSVIQSFVTGLIMGVVKKGLSEVETAVDDAVQSVEDEYIDATKEFYETTGPIVDFASDAYDTGQKINAQANAQAEARLNSSSSTWDNLDTATDESVTHSTDPYDVSNHDLTNPGTDDSTYNSGNYDLTDPGTTNSSYDSSNFSL